MSTVAQPSEQKTFEEEQKQQHQITHNKLVQRLLGSGANLPAFMAELARTQAAVVAGTEAVAFVIEPSPDGSALKLVQHIRNDNAARDVRVAAQNAFKQIIQPCVEQGKDGAIQVGDDADADGKQYCLVTLLSNEGAVVAVSAVICRCRNDDLAAQRLQAMQLVAGYFDLYTLRRSHEQSKSVAKSHQDVLQLASSLANAEGFQQGGAALCNEMAGRTGATRVSVGWIKGLFKGRDIVLQAISHTEEFDKKQELSVQLVRVMEECYDQQEIVQFDPAGRSTENTTREAAKLSQMEGGTRVVSLPLRENHEIRGILTLEFPKERPSTTQETTTLAVAAELLAPQLKDRYDNDRWLITKSILSGRDLTAKIIGPQYMLGKLIAICGLALVIFLFIPGLADHNVTAPFSLEPMTKRLVSTPIEGKIDEVHVLPGDVVEVGDPLLTFDTRESFNQMIAAEKQAASLRAE
ncbi:MAG: biotin/lipoyl-binding protein, partial [Planctomycetota bacterium]